MLSAFILYQPSILEANGWCGHTDTKKCCKDLDLTGKCSCVCIPGNCHCGPRITSPEGSNTLEPDTKFTIKKYYNGKLLQSYKIKNSDLQKSSTNLMQSTSKVKQSTSNTSTLSTQQLIRKGNCCAKVHNTCISCCYKKEGCTGKGDCKICGSIR